MDCKNNWETKLSPMLRDSTRSNAESFGRVIIEFAHGDEGSIISLIEKNQGIIKRKILLVPSIVAELPLAMIPVLARYAQVKKIWVDSEINIKD